jgi:thiol-disulfide isomerase/thioredoxin
VILPSPNAIAVTSSARTINRAMTFVPRNGSRAPMEEDATHRLPVLGPAPELVGVDLWFNTPDGEPLRLAALRDRVVLLEFWTFACVNCQRTLPFLRQIHRQYQPDFTVVGVHSPEFAFERSVENVERAVQEDGLEYPVGLDNEFVAWDAYGNRYWPTMYLIDRAGQIRYTQIGEGNYSRTEAAIRTLLDEAVGPAADARTAS